MVEIAPDENAAGVVAATFGPLPQDGHEVPRVAGYDYPLVSSRELEHLRIVQGAQNGIGREAHNVMTSAGQDGPDPLR